MFRKFISIPVILLMSIFLLSFKKEAPQQRDGIILSVFDSDAPIKISARALSEQEASSKVASEVDRQGYTVLAVAIENNSPYQWELKQENVDLDLVDKKKLMKSVHLSSLPRSIGYKIIGIFFWPAIIPGAIDSFVSMQRDHLFKDKLYASTVKKEGEIVIPYSSIQRYLYLPSKDIPKSFSLKLFNCRTLKYETYNVEIANA